MNASFFRIQVRDVTESCCGEELMCEQRWMEKVPGRYPEVFSRGNIPGKYCADVTWGQIQNIVTQ